jgi:Zn-dependent metalloprotease
MKKLIFLVAVFASVTVLAQRADPRVTALRVAQSFVTPRLATLNAGSALQAGEVVLDDLGQAHVRYQHLYRGVPVFESEAIVHVDLGTETVIDATDALLAFGTIDTQPGLGQAEARGRALAHFGLPPGLAGRDDLAVLVDGGVAYLSWRVRATGDDARGPIDKIAFVDALSGDVRRSWDNVETAAAAGTGKGFFNGTVGLTTDSKTGGFDLRDPSRGNQYTADMKNKQGGSPSIFTDSDNTWGDFTLANRQTVGVDAQYGTAETWDYYKLVHGRNGIANNGGGAFNRVHYGRNYNNAFWSDSCFCMTYGDGDGVTFNPFDSLDVAGHEMSHGVTSRTANLTYSGESGGLNEGNSDIFGTMVEFFANNPNDAGDYLIGEKLYKSGNGKALRYMYRPSLDGASADCWYSGVGSLNVHYSSGVANHFYYLLAEGTAPAGGPASPTCSATNTRVATGNGSVTGIGRADAEKIWYRALTVYMTSSSNYAAARAASLHAASDLFGVSTTDYARVAAAWAAVNVN